MNKTVKREKNRGAEPIMKSKAIMLNKYGLNVGAAYVEQSTLLEPNNFIPSWEAGDEEKKEVSNALRNLRQKFDEIHRRVMEKTNALEQLKKDVFKAQQEYSNVSKDTGGGALDKEQTLQHLDFISEAYLLQSLTKNVRNHMLDRQKKDFVALTIKINELTESLRSKTNIQTAESAEQMKSRQEKLQSQYKLHNLMKMIDHEQKKRQERILSLHTSIQNKQQALDKRLRRTKRQAEIAELAQNQSKDSNEIEKRQSLLVNRLWSAYFKKRMSREMANYRHIEESFQQIRNQTNNSDVREIVQKFMTKEQTYTQLLFAVQANEQRYDELKELNSAKAKKVRELQISNENRREIRKPSEDNEQEKDAYDAQMQMLMNTEDDTEAQESKYAHLQAEEQNLTVELESLNERKKNMQLINDQVGGWTKRVAVKLQDQLQGLQIQTQDRSIVDVLRDIAHLAKSQVAQIKQKQTDDQEDVGDKDYMGDFVSEEYLVKNIRVMPMASNAADNASEHTSKYYASAMGGAGTDGDFEETKHNQDVLMQMNEQRNIAKERHSEWTRKVQEAAEKEAKKKQK